MDFDLEKDIVLTEKQKKIDLLLTEYRNKGFKDFDTWDMDENELLDVLNKCLKENKSYEKIYGDIKYSKNIDY